jgi:ribonuclease HI
MDGARLADRRRCPQRACLLRQAWGSTGVGAVAILVSPSGIKLHYAARLQFHSDTDKCTNNIVEYEAILLGLCKLRAIGVQTCTLRIDSKVVECYFQGSIVEYIERTKNSKDAELVKAAAPNIRLPADTFFQVISNASIKIVEAEPRVINLVEGENRHAPIMVYLHHYDEPDNAINTPECSRGPRPIR